MVTNDPSRERDAFARVARLGLAIPGVDVTTHYNGLRALTLDGVFLAGEADPARSEPRSLVVRCTPGERALMLADAPDAYYVDAYHARHPVVLIRVDAVDDTILRDVLNLSWRLTWPKTARGRRRQRSVR